MKQKDKRNLLELSAAIISMFAGIVLAFMGFWVNPEGVIDYSVISMVGLLLSFSGAIMGIDYHYKQVITKIKEEEKEKDE